MSASADALRADGRALRSAAPRSAQGQWAPVPGRADPVAVLRRMSRSWARDLVPVRLERMQESPLAFLRGAAALMAADLAGTATTGLAVQAAGDAHLLNFGGFASPERRLLFDLDDFDETLPGPWEWDVKRLAASVAVAARELGGDTDSEAAAAAGRGYREAMARFAAMSALEVHGDSLDVTAAGGLVHGLAAQADEWSRHTNRWELPKLTGGGAAFVDAPPLTVPVSGAVADALRALPGRYGATVAATHAEVLERYAVTDVARHAVGVGSLGTACYAILLIGTEAGDPLFLQVKEARRSVLEAHTPSRAARPRGRRIVSGQQRAQAGADALLGWDTVARTPVYVRQLRDMRGAVDLRRLGGGELAAYAALCGGSLARTHARTGSAGRIAGYLGGSDRFDRALARFARSYADQTERDHAALAAASSLTAKQG